MAPRALKDGARPRLQSGASGRPFNSTVRRMSAVITHRVVEVLVGLALLGFSAYEIYTGEAKGAWRSYYRSEEPWWYWTSILLQLAITAAFLFGYTAWRK